MRNPLSKEISDNVYEIRDVMVALYGKNDDVIKNQQKRYRHLLKLYTENFHFSEVQFFSTPGRIEIGGNHTDHNHGCVLATAINLDSIAAADKTDDNRITVYSEGYQNPFNVNLDQLDPIFDEQGTTTALIRGIAARLLQLGYQIGGFCAQISSDVLPGSGLSSSASIEVLIATIFNAFYNNGDIPEEEMAKIGQYAENNYFGKPCGLMDQTACAVGGVVFIDFEKPESPQIKQISYNFTELDYRMIVVNTGGSHADLTAEYASIPREMIAVANYFNQNYCRDISMKDLLDHIEQLRSKTGDRALLRAFHFIEENKRVEVLVSALKNGDLKEILRLINESGDSSFKWLQNCYSTKNVSEQGVSLALALTDSYIKKIGQGASRVHGGGFAGTILVFLPANQISDYINLMETVFGEKSTLILDIRNAGTVRLNSLM
jgi:galactokinase